jgi:uncharacterized membrane-anchored protein YitT (DUF2179 family)
LYQKKTRKKTPDIMLYINTITPTGLVSQRLARMNFISAAVTLCCVFVLSIADDKLLVETVYGKLQGKIAKNKWNDKLNYHFLGIPYAKPPVGELRFKVIK